MKSELSLKEHSHPQALWSVRAPRKPVTRIRRLTLGTLDAPAREALRDELYSIYRENSDSLSRERFGELFFSHPATRVALFHGPDGELAGFSNASILRVSHEGREHAVFSAGVYFRLAYEGGNASALFGLTEALRFKLREPRTPLAYLSMASTPAPYCLFTRTVDRLYPSRHHPTPPAIEALVREVSRQRGLEPTPPGPWLVRSFVRPRQQERLKASDRLRDNPDAHFFLSLNPRYAEGEGTALLVWIPLDLANVFAALGRAAWRFVRPRSRAR